MATNSELLQMAQTFLYPNYRPAPFVLSRGKGCEVFDVEGKRYLDLCAGVAVCSVGHAHPDLVKAISTQVGTLTHVSNWFYNEQGIRAASELCRISGMNRVLFCNSGGEANEALLKLSRHHFYAKGEKKRMRMIAFDAAFHGRTLGALSMTGTPKYREGFGELGPVTHVPYGDLDAVSKAMGDDVAGIIVEPIQGEGGVTPAPEGFLKGLASIAKKHGALFLVDEVQTGVGRLGVWFAYQLAGVKPDAISIAKGIGGGFPIGAMLTTEAMSQALPAGTHGTTFGGNPLGASAILSVIDIVEKEGLMKNAVERGEQLHQGLCKIVHDFPSVCETARGIGLLRGLVMRPGFAAREVAAKLFAGGTLIIGAGDRVLRYAPPLIVTAKEIEEGLGATRAVIASLAK